MISSKNSNVVSLNTLLEGAEQGRYAVGSFSPRYTPLIRPVLRAGEKLGSPLIIQISSRELGRYEITPIEFAEEFYKVLQEDAISVPVALHLDHTADFEVIKAAIAAGFNSVMIDASSKPFADNVATTQKVADYANDHGVSVEAELGRIGTTDFVETDTDEELFTVPEEAREFVEQTKVDALAVSVGTAHGVYKVRQPRIDFERLEAIRKLTPVHLVLHGGSGVPSSMLRQAISCPGGGISKVNIATDLEQAFLAAIGREEYLTNQACIELDTDLLKVGQAAVENVVVEKMTDFLGSAGQVSNNVTGTRG